MSDSASTPPPPATPVGQTAGKPSLLTRRVQVPVWAIAAAAALVVVVVATTGGSPDDTSTEQAVTTTLPASANSQAPLTSPFATTAPTTTTQSATVPKPTVLGTRENPIPLGEPVTLANSDGSIVWEVTVLAPGADITESVAQENRFNDPPPAGSIFYGITVRVTLVSADEEPVSPWLDFSWSMFSTTDLRLVDEGCGVIPANLDDLAELFVGASLEGAKCWPLSAQDAAGAPLLALQPMFGDYVYLATA